MSTKTNILTAEEARAKLAKALPHLEEERIEKERLEEQRRKEETKKEEKRIREAVEQRVFNLSKEIAMAIEKGQDSIRLSINGDDSVFRVVCSEFEKLGYTVLEQNSTFVPEDRGDKDSGEGAHDSFWVNCAVISWAPKK